jgi:hypothetical protein
MARKSRGIPAAARRSPKPVRRVSSCRDDIPTFPGKWYWTAWHSTVTVVKRGNSLYVTPPCTGAVEVKVTPNIAGSFRVVPPKETVG